MKRIAFYLSLVLVVLVLASCKKGQKNLFTPTSSGRPYEVLVVVNKPVWDRPAGRALFDVLDTNVPGLPQAERSFRISNVDPQHFDRVLKIFRNIIIVDIQDIYTQPKLKFSRDVYASPQMIMTIQAPNEDEFEEFVAKNSKVIIDFFVKAEMNRQITLLKQKHSDVISTKVGSIFDCDIWVPVELANYKEGKDFLWASTNRATADMNFVMYSYPYTDKDTFTKDYFIHKRDSVMKVNIPGEREGMYMETADSAFVSSILSSTSMNFLNFFASTPHCFKYLISPSISFTLYVLFITVLYNCFEMFCFNFSNFHVSFFLLTFVTLSFTWFV